MSRVKKLVIFDMDGTLINSSLTIARAINSVRKNLSLPPMNEKNILEKVNDPDLNPAKYFYEAETFTKNHEKWFAAYYSEHHKEELELYTGMVEFLKELKKEGFLLAVATNAYRKSTLESLNHLEVIDLFSDIACHDDVKRGKPHPDMLEKLLKNLNITVKDAIFIGDSERDELAAKALKMDYIMVNWGFSNYEDAIHSVAALKEKIIKA